MQDQPEQEQIEESSGRFHFASFTFLTGFGFGIFAGVLLALLAVIMVEGNGEEPAGAAVSASPTQEVASLAPATATPDSRPRTKSAIDIRLGPGSAFAVIGTMNRGEAVEVVGRDAASAWAAIRFPPGSAARGWVQTSEIDGLANLERLSVLLPTPLPRTLGSSSTPFDFPSSNGGNGANGSANNGSTSSSSALVTGTPVTPTPTPAGTRPPSTPAPAVGPSDLVATRATLMSDGRVQVTIGNRGPGDLVNKTVFVIVRDLTLRSEQLSISPSVMTVGSVLTLQTSGFRVSQDTDVQVIVDPFGSLQDPDTGNNRLTVNLTPAAVPTPTRSPLE